MLLDLEPGEKKKNTFNVTKTCHDKYEATPKEELAEYVLELEETKNKEAVAKRVTPKSKVMDIFQTIEKVQEAVSIHVVIHLARGTDLNTWQLTGCFPRTGFRSIVAGTRSSADFNQKPIFWAVDPVAGSFLLKVLVLDIQEVLTKMEGYFLTDGTLSGRLISNITWCATHR
jgi:hypothetical protein